MKSQIKNIILIFVLIHFSLIATADTSLTPANIPQTNKAMFDRQAELFKELNSIEPNTSKASGIAGTLGMFYQAHDMLPSAEQAYVFSLNIAEFNPKWHHLVAIVYHDRGNYDKAIEHFILAIKYNPYYVASHIRLADTYLQIAEFDKAMEIYTHQLEQNQNDAYILSQTGMLLLQQGQYLEAKNSFLKALKIQPQANQLHFLLAQALRGLNEDSKAEYHMTLKGDNRVKLHDNLVEVMLAESRNPIHYINRSYDAYFANKFKQAEAYSKQAIVYGPNDEFAHFSLANALTAQKKYQQALSILDTILKSNPGSSRAYYAKALIYEYQNKIAEAIEHYNKAVSLDKNNPEAARLQALALLRNGKFNLAYESLDNAIKLNPDNPYLHYRLANLNAYFKKCEPAEKHIKEALVYLPENLFFNYTFAKISLMCNQDSHKKALLIAQKLYSIEPNMMFIDLLAKSEYLNGNMKNAKDYQTQLIYQAIVENHPQKQVDFYRDELEQMKNNSKIEVSVKAEDSVLNPEFPPKF